MKKRLSFLCIFGSFVETQVAMPVRAYFWFFYSPAVIHMSVFVQYSALAVGTAMQCELRLGIVMLSALFILFRIFSFPLYFHMDFRVVVSVYGECHLDFGENCTELGDGLGNMATFTASILLIYGQKLSFSPSGVCFRVFLCWFVILLA